MSFLPAVLVAALSLGISTSAFAERDFDAFLIGPINVIFTDANALDQTQRSQLDAIEAQINLIKQPAVRNVLQAKLSAARASMLKDVNSIKTSAQSLKATVNQIQSIQESLKKAAVLQATHNQPPTI